VGKAVFKIRQAASRITHPSDDGGGAANGPLTYGASATGGGA
jgi:hypothetical protein